MNAQSSHDGERLFSVLKYPVPHAVRGRSKRSRSNERTFQNGWFRELKIARESNELAKGFRRNKRFTNFIGAHKESCLVFKHRGKDAIFFYCETMPHQNMIIEVKEQTNHVILERIYVVRL